MEFIKRNFALILAFSLPLLLILGIALSTYLPSFLLSPNYNFIYSMCNDYDGGSSYYCYESMSRGFTIINGKITAQQIDPGRDANRNNIPDVNEMKPDRIFLHDTSKNESREITLQEAETLTLNSLTTSPDGLTFSYSYERGPNFLFLFGGSSNYGYYLTKGSARLQLNLPGNIARYYDHDIQFVGWILPGRN